MVDIKILQKITDFLTSSLKCDNIGVSSADGDR